MSISCKELATELHEVSAQSGRTLSAVQEMARFVLVHGAFHGAWCWRKTVAELEKRGHQAQAIDLPGQGDDTTPLSKVTLESMADHIVATLDGLPGRAVLVGHSAGGMAISAARLSRCGARRRRNLTIWAGSKVEQL